MRHALDARILGVASYSSLLWAVQATKVAPDDRSEIRIYKIATSPAPSVTIEKKYTGATGVWYFVPQIMMNDLGRGAITFTRSSRSNNYRPTIMGAQFTFGPGQLAPYWQSEFLIWESPDSFRTSTVDHRWGDFAGASPDPTTGSVWVYGEYAKTNVSRLWGTRMARLDF